MQTSARQQRKESPLAAFFKDELLPATLVETGSATAAIWLVSKGQGGNPDQLVFAQAAGEHEKVFAKPGGPSHDVSAESAFKTGTEILLPDVHEEEGWLRALEVATPGDAEFLHSYQCQLAVPLKDSATSVIAVLALYHRAKKGLTSQSAGAVRRLAGKAARAIENAAQFELVKASKQWMERLVANLLEINVEASDASRSIFDLVTDHARKLALADFVGLWLHCKPTGEWHLASETRVGSSGYTEFRTPVTTGIRGQVFETGEAYYCADTRSDSHFSKCLPNVFSCYVIPLMMGEKLIGVLCIDSLRTSAFEDQELRSVLDHFGQHASLLISRRLAEIEARLEKEFHIDLIKADSDKDLCRQAVQIATKLSGADGASLFLWDDNRGKLALAGTTGLADVVGAAADYEPGEGITGWVFQHDVPIRLKNCGDAEECAGWGKDLLWKGRTREIPTPRGVSEPLLAVPVPGPDHRPIGVLRATRSEAKQFLEEDKLALIRLARLVSSELRRPRAGLAQLIAEVQQAANLEAGLKEVLKRCIEVTGADYGTIAILENDRLLNRAIHGKPIIDPDGFNRDIKEDCVVCLVARTGTARMLPDVTHADWAPIYQRCFPHVLSEMALPITHLGRVRGVINLESRQEDFFTLEKQVQLELHAGIAGSLIAYQQLSRTHQELKNRLESWFGVHARHIVEDPDFAKPALVGKPVAILFADIRQSTKAIERLTNHPELVLNMLTDYMSSMTSLIHRRGGVIANVMGDGILALFGLYDGQTNGVAACEAAVLAAAEAKKEFNRLRHGWYQQWRERLEHGIPPVGIGIGVHAGERVFFGKFGGEQHWQLTAVGDDVNVAAKLGDDARDGEVLVTAQLRSAFPDESSCPARSAGSPAGSGPRFSRDSFQRVRDILIGDLLVAAYRLVSE